MRLTKTIKTWANTLTDPRTTFSTLHKRSFESVLHEYLLLLILVSAAAGVFLFLLTVGKAFYFNLRYVVDINYWRLLNYASGSFMALLFFFFFSGTFILFILSLLISPFVRAKYTTLLKTLFISTAPILLLGWILPIIAGLLVWSLILFVSGLRVQQRTTKKGSIKERE